MSIELSDLTFSEQDDVVPQLGKKDTIFNNGIANTLAGNDTITSFGNSFYLEDPSKQYSFLNFGTLNMAEGNDIITVDTPSDGLLNFGTFNTAEGNDIITVDSEGATGIVNSGTLNTGEGYDIITIKGGKGNSEYLTEPSPRGLLNFGTFNTAGGDDAITAESYSDAILIQDGSIFDTGDGNDRIKGNNNDISFNYNFSAAISNRSYDFNTGDGNDTIEGNGGIRGIYNEGSINTGKGKDTIIASVKVYDTGFLALSNSSFSTIPIIDTGEDDDIITVDGAIFNGGIIDTGNGDDLIVSNVSGDGYFNPGIDNSNVIETGDGNDTIEGNGGIRGINNRGAINTGNGKDIIIASSQNIFEGSSSFFNGSTIDTGDDNDTITSTGVIYNEGVINTGNGDDSIIVNGGIDNITGTAYGIYNNGGSIDTGNGNDFIIANEGFESGSNSSGSVFLGEGEDYIKGFGNGDFYGGNGNDTLELTPGTYTVGIWGEGGESPIFTKGDQLMITSEFEKLKAGSTVYDFTSLTAGQIIIVA